MTENKISNLLLNPFIIALERVYNIEDKDALWRLHKSIDFDSFITGLNGDSDPSGTFWNVTAVSEYNSIKSILDTIILEKLFSAL